MKIAIIGCGNIGSGMARILAKGNTVALYDRNSKKASDLAKEVGGKAYGKAAEASGKSEAVILAIKSQSFQDAEEEIGSALTSKHVLVSIMSGTTLHTLGKAFKKVPIVRMTSNLALIYGKGVVILAENGDLPKGVAASVSQLFSGLGFVHWVPESKMDALTSLVGSGPAFVLLMFEAMVDAGLALGFQAKDGQKYMLEMLESTIALLKGTGKSPADIKSMITSPAGTTIAGLKVMEEYGVRGSIINTFLAAAERSKELGK